MAEQNSPYEYTPSLAGGIVVALIFVALLGLHLFRLYQHRTWFCIPFSIGAICKCPTTHSYDCPG